jgi:hypothetical protein
MSTRRDPPAPAGEDELALRITVLSPPPGAHFAMQRGKHALHPASAADAESLRFDFTLRLAPDGAEAPPRWLGEFAQGPPAVRFVYLNSGGSAGPGTLIWSRRAKVPLAGISHALIEAARRTPGSVIECRIAGRARDGGPCCASVPLLDGGWRLAGRTPS